MPRPLEFERQTGAREPNGGAASQQNQAGSLRPSGGGDAHDKLLYDMEKTSRRESLHVYTRPLTISNLDACVALENAAFPPEEAADPKKIAYRLTVCPELSLGIFTSANFDRLAEDADVRALPTAAHAVTVESAHPARREVLLGHIMSTMMTTPTVTEDAMALPPNSPSQHATIGHQPSGRTIGLHSLAVAPQQHGIGLGSVLLKDYLQRMSSSGMATHISILAHDQMLPYYEKIGFSNLGKSDNQYGGGGWLDMSFDLKDASGFNARAKEEQRKKIKAIFSSRNQPVSSLGQRRSI